VANISKNQYDYLQSKVAEGGGNAEWAKDQLANSTYTPPSSTNTPAPNNVIDTRNNGSVTYDYHNSYPSSSSTPSGGSVGVRDYFEKNGYQVNYNSANGGITIVDPKTGKASYLDSGNYNNDNGSAYISQDAANSLMNNFQPQQSVQPQQVNPMQWLQQQQDQLRQQLQARAQQEAAAIAKQKRDALSQLVEQLKGNQQTGLQGIQNSVEDAKQGVEDSSFQQWLAARQAMANRGLAGSGLASDQDTRLLLAKQRDLAGVYRNAQTQSQTLNNQYTNQLNNAYQQLAAINPDATAADLFNKYYTDGQKSLNDQFQTFADLYKWNTPSANNTQDNQTKMYEWNNVSANDMLKNTQFYDKLNQDGKIEAAKLALNLKQYDLDVAKVMGVDQNGNPTLDAQKLYEEMRHNQASEGIASANVSLGAARLQQSIASAQQKANMDMLKLQNSQWGKQGQLLKSLADSKLSLASRALEAVKANPDDYGAKTEYEAAIRDANAAQKALEAVANGSDASSAYSQSQGNYATSWGGI
jgi:hypothetical protein